ncbi:MAG: hypothetical protein NW217_00470 [Hyphomicrobiaceae bacterium]|nr:hypothetical protein [Hyphomicrobiaceae bacterium]
MFSWLLGKRSAKAVPGGLPPADTPVVEPVSPAGSTIAARASSSALGAVEPAATALPASLPTTGLGNVPTNAGPFPAEPVLPVHAKPIVPPVHAPEAAPAFVSSPPRAVAVTDLLEPAPPAGASKAEEPILAAGSASSAIVGQAQSGKAIVKSTIAVTAGMPVIEQTGRARRSGTIIGIKANGRRVVARFSGSLPPRVYVRQPDGIYRLEGARGSLAPVLTLTD